MYLLSSEGPLRLKEFMGLENTPRYAVLSHTWLSSNEEILFEHVNSWSDTFRDKYPQSFNKIEGCRERALKDGYHYIWIDTCCIDQGSTAEVSEAINSMFRLYKRAEVCYVHLADVESTDGPTLAGSAFRKSRWFKRGWTLQELIAPREVLFFTSTWEPIDNKHHLSEIIQNITGVPSSIIRQRTPLNEVSVVDKMSWATRRQTARPEDEAYSLMGLFGVNMTIDYSEGRERAFERLQHGILEQSAFAHDILAWQWQSSPTDHLSVLAPSVECFRLDRSKIVTIPPVDFNAAWDLGDELLGLEQTNVGLEAIFQLDDIRTVAAIACKIIDGTREHSIGIMLKKVSGSKDFYNRAKGSILTDVDELLRKAPKDYWELKKITLVDLQYGSSRF